MAVITQTNAGATSGPINLTKTVLSASDTLTYSSATRQFLHLFNTTASPVVCTITGSTATTISPAGFGGTVSVSSGKAVTVPASGVTLVELNEISAFLLGSITVTGGVGVEATLYTI